MDKQYLVEYEHKEREKYQNFLAQVELTGGSFDGKIYPPYDRFTKLNRPIAKPNADCKRIEDIWAQIPFCGSLIFSLPVCPQKVFEALYCKISEIPKLIDFAKETGRLQFALQAEPTKYEGFTHLDPFFKELTPPVLYGLPATAIMSREQVNKAFERYYKISTTFNNQNLSYLSLLQKASSYIQNPSLVEVEMNMAAFTYSCLSNTNPDLARMMENVLSVNPLGAWRFIHTLHQFLVYPNTNLIIQQYNYSMNELRDAENLPAQYRREKPEFPCEIGRFLINKLTYAPISLGACKEMIYHYELYDLKELQDSLNEGIMSSNLDILGESSKEISEILENVWTDKTLPNRIKGLKIGVPLMVAGIGAAFGTYVSGPMGASTGGFLASLGYNIVNRAIDKTEEGLCEKIAKITVNNYQANVFDFKKSYKINRRSLCNSG